jgi:hypothetical protein
LHDFCGKFIAFFCKPKKPFGSRPLREELIVCDCKVKKLRGFLVLVSETGRDTIFQTKRYYEHFEIHKHLKLRFLGCQFLAQSKCLSHANYCLIIRYYLKLYLNCNVRTCRFLWSSGLRRGSTADRLLGLRVRIPPGAWMFVLCVAQ